MQTVGFIGLGTMGAPIATNLATAGVSLLVWNRTADKCRAIASAGAAIASTAEQVFLTCKTVILMLTDGAALDAVLERGTPAFENHVRDHTIVSMATNSSAYSTQLAQEIAQAGGRYVEAPVSGSRRPAELGQLIALLAGNESVARRVEAILQPACRTVIYCGAVPNGLLMKHATNLLLIPTLVAIAEAGRFVRHAGLDIEAFSRALLAGQMASDLLRAKLPKVVAQDYEVVQSSLGNVLLSAEAAVEAVRSAGSGGALIEQSLRILTAAQAGGLEALDVLALATIEARAD